MLHKRPDFVLKTCVCNGAEMLLMTPDKTDSGISDGSPAAVSCCRKNWSTKLSIIYKIPASPPCQS